MARMHPAEIPLAVERDPQRSSEIAIYERLRDQLPDDFVCYYSAPWHHIDEDGFERDGEADFVIAHRELGLLFLEVKGGRVSRRESDGQWISVDRHGISYRIKDPIAQARSSKHVILKKLRDVAALRSRFIRAVHAAALPGCSRPGRPLGPDAPHDLVAFGDDMATLGRWIRQRMEHEEDQGEGLGSAGVAALHDLLGSRFELRAHVGLTIAEDTKRIAALTAEQSWILESFDGNPQMAVSGGAGSGKTVLAIEKARRSADAGRRTLLVCYNRALAAYLRRTVGETPDLVVGSFHSICRRVSKNTGVELKGATQRERTETGLADALVEATDANPTLCFETIVVDEGQDFDDGWLLALRMALRDSDQSGLYVFYDDNQILFDRDRKFIESLPKARYRLNKNLRNTKRIHEAMSTWYLGGRVYPVGPEGVPVDWVTCDTAEGAVKRASSEVARALKHGEFKPGQIAVLTASARNHGDQWPSQFGGVMVHLGEDANDEGMVYDTVRRFKGLSRPCVYLIDVDKLVERELIYVALSRANVLLRIFGTVGDMERIKGRAG